MAPPDRRAIRRLEWAFTAFKNKNLKTLHFIKNELNEQPECEAYIIAIQIIDGFIHSLINQKDPISASEALYGFISWITARDKELILSAKHTPYDVMNDMKMFCEVNQLSDPRERYTDFYKLPADGGFVDPKNDKNKA